MNAYYEYTTDNGIIVMDTLSNLLVEEIEDTISIHADGGFMMTIPRSEIESEIHEDDLDVYKMEDGSCIKLSLF